MTLELPHIPGETSLEVVSRIAAVIDRITFSDDTERRRFQRAVLRAKSTNDLPEPYKQLILKAEQKSERPAPPLSPRLERLPLEQLNWDAFQEVSRDLIARLPRVRDCHQYGKEGETQLGIDLFAEFENGERWAFQNKRWKKFGPKAVDDAVKATSYTADRFILLLSREATVSARKAVAKHPGWDIWDVRDISQKVRELPLDSARRLLNHHFGAAVRRAFLGVSAVSTFLTAEDFFRLLLDSSKLFNHTWSLVGRATHLQQLHRFVDADKHRVAILSGRGGIGKTKLLHTFSQSFVSSHANYTLRFLADGLSVTTESLDELPMSACVVVVDDAHRRGNDVAALLAVMQQRTHPLKVILSARPQGVDHLNSLMNQAGVDEREIARVGTLSDLSREETKELARQALGKEHEYLVDRLVAATRDCPLVTVVGAQLLGQYAVDPRLLDQHDDFRQSVLTKFQDILIGQSGDRIEPAICRAVLKMIAAVAPIQPDNEQFQDAAARFIATSKAVVTEAVSVLEAQGILLRRGYTLRIAPDVLADHVLYSACVTSGRPTGFASQVYEHFAPVCLTHVLQNLAELDWRVQRATGEQTDLLADIWHGIREHFETGPTSVRCQILDALQEVAYYQPGRMLGLVQHAMTSPAKAPEEERASRFHEYTHNDVLYRLPGILKRISYTLDYLPTCADLLWQLGRDDARTTTPVYEHPMRVLRDLAAYQLEKPFAVNLTMLGAVRRWLDDTDANNHLHSPLDVLDPLFAKTGHTSYSEGHQIRLCSFKLSRQELQTIRDDALALVRNCAFSGAPKVGLRALGSLEDALRAPLPVFTMEISQEDRSQWVPEQLKILGFLRELAQKTTHSLVHLKIMEILRWHGWDGAAEVRGEAREIIAAIPDSFELRLTRLLTTNRAVPDLDEGEEDVTAAVQRSHQRLTESRKSGAQEYWELHPNPRECFHDLNQRLQTIENGGSKPHPENLLDALLESRPDRAEEFCEATLESPDCPLGICFGLFLAYTRRVAPEKAAALARRALETGHVLLARTVADFCNRGIALSVDVDSEEVAILRALLCHTDICVRSICIGALRWLGRSHPEAAIALARLVDIGTSADLGDDLCAIFHSQYGILPDGLSDDDLSLLLQKLEPIDRLDHHVHEFLGVAAARRPHQVVQVLLRRVERGDDDYQKSFEPLPYLGLHQRLSGLAESDEYEDILRSVRDRALEPRQRSRFWLGKLFEEVSLGYAPASLPVLREWIDSGESDKIQAAGFLLQEAPSGFVFDQIEFVCNALDRAYVAGAECYRRVSNDLYHCAVYHGRQRVGGGPFPQDIALRDQAAATAQRLQPGSSQRRFYDSLVRRALQNIQDLETRDEMLEES
jgi:hypothetical protein